MTYKVSHFINGQIVSASGEMLPIYNPATGAKIGEVDLADTQMVQNAVQAAQTAYPNWAAQTPLKRARILFKYKALLEDHAQELAALITNEHGKTFVDALSSIQRGVDVVEFVCGIPNLLKGSYSQEVGTGIDSYTVRQPLGVSLGITPFNFPAMIPLWMFPMAIACGNTFVLKPSEKNPSCALRLAQLAKVAGLPDGVLNVVQGDKNAVAALLTHQDIKTVSFVGSTPVAEHVYKTAIAQGKRVQTFGGAKNHCVVMPDADLDHVAEALTGAAFGSAGERCMAISVVVMVGNDARAEELAAKITQKMEKLKIGPGMEPSQDMGPLISKAHRDKVAQYIDSGVAEGAKLLVDGRDFKMTDSNAGFFLGVSLFDQVKPHMRIYREEIFGPVLSIMRLPDLESAIKLINEHEYGNGTAIFTRDGYAARHFAKIVQVGMVGINIPIPVPVAYHSFGGWKRSFFGDIAMHGGEGVQFYTQAKTITERWPNDQAEKSLFSMPVH